MSTSVQLERDAALRQAQRVAKLGYGITRSDSTLESWSETLPVLIGAEPARMPKTVREWLLTLIHPDDQAKFRDAGIAAAQIGARFDIEYRLRRGDGEWIVLRHVVDPLDEGDAATGDRRWFNTVQDVTAQRRTGCELEQFRAAMDASADSIYLTDLATLRFVYVNDTACTGLGYSREQLLESGPQNVLHISREELLREFDAVIAAGNAGLIQQRAIPRGDGSELWSELHRRALHTRDGTLIITIGRDVTERKRAEQLLALEHAVARRLAEAEDAAAGLIEVIRAMCESEGWEIGRYWRVDDASRVLRLGGSWHAGDPALAEFDERSRGFVFAPGEGLAGRVWQSGEPLWSSDTSTDARVVQAASARDTGMRAAFVFPIAADGRTLGVVGVSSRETRAPDERLLAAVRVIGGQLGQFLMRKQAEDRVRRLNRVYAVLSGINTLIVRVHDRDELFGAACRIAVEAGGFRAAWLGVVDAEARVLRPVAWQGLEEDFLRLVRSKLDDTAPGIAVRAVLERKSMIIDDMKQDPRIRLKEQARRHDLRSLAVLPLLVAGESVGVLALYASEAGFFDGEELKLLEELAGDIGFALDHIEKKEKLDYLAFFDQLTGLANRKLFLERLAQKLDMANGSRKIALVLADIERFKAINDSLGRQAGDELLRQLTGRLSDSAGASSVARIGGDLFAIMFPEIKGRSETARTATAIWRDCFAKPFRVNGTELRVAAKGGIALYPSDGKDADALFASAEAALAQAQKSGERFFFHTRELTAGTADQLALENKLRQALERDEFILHYQPKVDLGSGEIVGVEALIRWQSPELGLVPPLKFIPLMEETGLILEAGAWALRQAARDHRRWFELGLEAPRVAVNVSALQLRQRDFVAQVEQAIIEGLAPTGIDLEVTESLIMEDVRGCIEKMKAIRGLGVQMAIDDFGTGYSSLGYLAKLPVQTLKIDRSFIITMLNDSDSMLLVKTIISLAHALKLKVVAEGVDAEDQARFLRQLRCDQMQGYLVSKPIPFEQMTALLRQRQG